MADSTKPTVRREPTALQNFVAGGVGGIIVVLIGHPFDTVKVRSVLLHVDLNGRQLFYEVTCIVNHRSMGEYISLYFETIWMHRTCGITHRYFTPVSMVAAMTLCIMLNFCAASLLS